MSDKRKSYSDVEIEEEEFASSLDLDRAISGVSTADVMSGKSHPEQDKRVRREIANSNERRRMQSINAGFQSLRTLIPHSDGEKMSKAGILQSSAEHIQNLESEKTRLLSQNSQLKAMVRDMSSRHPHASTGSTSTDSDSSASGSPPPKRKKRDTESSDEGISMGFDDPVQEDLKREMIELRRQLERERRMRMRLEDERRGMEARMYPENIRNVLPTVPAAPAQPLETVPKPEPTLPVRQHYTEQQRHLQEQQEKRMESAKPLESRPPSLLPSSMSRRNLETIVEAIRHLEGDGMLDVGNTPPRVSPPGGTTRIPEVAANLTESAEEDCSSGQDSDSPLCLTVTTRQAPAPAPAMPTNTTTKALPATTPPTSTADRYPIAMQLLHPAVPGVTMLPPPGVTMLPPPPAQFVPHRPAVIVQKSS